MRKLQTADREGPVGLEAAERIDTLRGAVESDLEGVIARKAAQEAQAVAVGTMRAEDTMAALIQRQVDD